MMNELATTPHGRLLSLAMTIALAGGGIASTIHDPMGVALMCVSLLASIVLSLLAIVLSIDSRPSFGVLSIILLPFLLFLYVIGLTVGTHHHAAWPSYAFIGLGALIGLNAVRGGKPAHTGSETPAHAH
jgi:hypothetical protein